MHEFHQLYNKCAWTKFFARMFFVEFGNPACLVFTSIRYLCIRWRVLTFVICITQLYTEKRSGVPTQFTCRENEKEEANFFFSFSVQVVCVFCKPLWDNLLVTRETYSLLFTLQSKVLLWPMNLLGMFTAQQVSENIPFSHLFLTLVKIPFDCSAIATHKDRIPRRDF